MLIAADVITVLLNALLGGYLDPAFVDALQQSESRSKAVGWGFLFVANMTVGCWLLMQLFADLR